MKRKRLIIVLTILNVLLCITSIICLVGTCRNNEAINTTERNYTYREDDGKVIFSLESGEVTMRFGKNSVKIEESYRFADRESEFVIVLFIRGYAAEKGYEILRANTELYGELRLHNFLYALGYERKRTGDCDLDYAADARWYVNAASTIIGRTGI